MKEISKLVYITNDNYDYIKEKTKEHPISESDLVNIAINFFKSYDDEVLRLISIYGIEALKSLGKL